MRSATVAYWWGLKKESVLDIGSLGSRRWEFQVKPERNPNQGLFGLVLRRCHPLRRSVAVIPASGLPLVSPTRQSRPRSRLLPKKCPSRRGRTRPPTASHRLMCCSDALSRGDDFPRAPLFLRERGAPADSLSPRYHCDDGLSVEVRVRERGDPASSATCRR